MTEFKIGDKVRIVENKSSSANKVGEIGVITHLNRYDCFVEVVKGRFGCYHLFSDLELVKEESKFYKEVVTREVVLNRGTIHTELPSGDKFSTCGGSGFVTVMSLTKDIRNSDIPTIIEHLQQWYDAVQLEKGNKQ